MPRCPRKLVPKLLRLQGRPKTAPAWLFGFQTWIFALKRQPLPKAEALWQACCWPTKKSRASQLCMCTTTDVPQGSTGRLARFGFKKGYKRWCPVSVAFAKMYYRQLGQRCLKNKTSVDCAHLVSRPGLKSKNMTWTMVPGLNTTNSDQPSWPPDANLSCGQKLVKHSGALETQFA